MPESHEAEPDLEGPLRRAYGQILWLGATVLFVLSVALITVPALQPSERRSNFWFGICLALGINFLSGAVGAALFEILIRRPQEEGLHQARATRADAVSIRERIDTSIRGLDALREELGPISAFLGEHRDFRYLEKLQALDAAEITALYRRRNSADPDMRKSLLVPSVTHVRLLGVTLSDFVRGGRGSPWSVIDGYIRGEERLPAGAQRLTVRVLICDPSASGARLFSVDRPAGGGGPRISVLDEDSANVSARLRALKRIADERHDIALEYRYYRTAPQYFLCGTNFTSYVQPYYLSQTSPREATMPVLRYDADSGIHDAMTQHFEALWRYASVSANDLQAGSVGIDRGAGEAGLVEVFTSAERGRARMTWLLENAERRVWIQGISLIPILADPLDRAFEVAAMRDGVQLRVMLLDPASETAFKKTYSLYHQNGQFRDHAMTWDEYCKNKTIHHASNTCDNINRAIGWFTHLSRRLPTGKLEVRLTSTVESFKLLADDRVLMEPYHYGGGSRTRFPSQTPLQLAEDMPLLEFRPPASTLFPRPASRANPVALCVAHLDRVFNEFSTPAPPR